MSGIPTEQRLFVVTEQLVHKRIDRTANNQIDVTLRFVEVPNALHFAVNRLVDTNKFLKFVYYQCDVLCF